MISLCLNYSLTIAYNVSMNIYLDIDGVLLANDREASRYADEFLQGVLSKYPNSTYWLTTHYWRDQNTTRLVLAPHLKPETIALLDKIKPTTWGDFKTQGIDFSQPFLWFDDDLFDEEREELEKHNALSSWIEVDLYKDENQLQQLTELL